MQAADLVKALTVLLTVGFYTLVVFHTGYYVGRLRQWTRTERFLNEPKYFQVMKELNEARRKGKI